MSTAKKAAKRKPQLSNTKILPAGTKLERHWLSALFPDASEGQTENLRNSLRTHGQQNPIVLLEGKVIDGWGRYTQQTGLNQDLLVADYIGDDPVVFVYAQNYCRRDLTERQRLMSTARLANLKQGKPKAGAKQVNLSLSLEEAVKLTGISESTIKNAKKVIDSKNSDLIQSVESGKISVDMGLKLIDKPKDKIEEVLASKNPKKTFKELFPPSDDEAPKPEDPKSTDLVSEENAVEQKEKPSSEKESEKGTPAAESAKESAMTSVLPEAPTNPNQPESTAAGAPTEHEDADSLFAYVQAKLQIFSSEQQDQFWDLIWKAFKQEAQSAPVQNEPEAEENNGEGSGEDIFDQSDLLQGSKGGESDD